MIAYRMQDKDRSIEALLDPEQQYSFPMDNDDDLVRHGVSGCMDLTSLAAYIACCAIEASCPVIVEIEGPESEDTPLDADFGEVLLLPTRARVIEPGDAWWEAVGDLADDHYTNGGFGLQDYRRLLGVAEDMLDN